MCTIDTTRRRLGRSMEFWTEREWIARVPTSLRNDHHRREDKDGPRIRSYRVLCDLLTTAEPTERLDHSVFYLASKEYDVGVLIVYNATEEGDYSYRHVGGEDKSTHIVLYHVCAHYEVVEYNGLRQFPSGHELIVALSRLPNLADEPAEWRWAEEELPELEAELAASGVEQSAAVASPRPFVALIDEPAEQPSILPATNEPAEQHDAIAATNQLEEQTGIVAANNESTEQHTLDSDQHRGRGPSRRVQERLERSREEATAAEHDQQINEEEEKEVDNEQVVEKEKDDESDDVSEQKEQKEGTYSAAKATTKRGRNKQKPSPFTDWRSMNRDQLEQILTERVW